MHGGYKFGTNREAVIRFYNGEHKNAGVSTDLSNTYLGMNFFFGSKPVNGRLQVNYVLAGGDTGGVYAGQRGYKDNALLIQYQASF